MHENIRATVNGYEYRQPKKPNAFLNPEDPNAEFPQYIKPRVIDMRSAYVPFGGAEWVGARRKKVKDVQILVDNLHNVQTEFENEQIDELEDQMNAQNWNDEEEEKEEQIEGATGGVAGEEEIVEEKLSKKSLLKSIVKDKKVVKKPQRKSRRILKF